MKRNIATAVLSTCLLAASPFASAGQAPNYPGYGQNRYNGGAYYQTDPRENRAPVYERQQYGRGWDRGADRREGYGRNDYYDRNGYYGGGYEGDRYGYERSHRAGRSAAIIGGSAAAGAVLGAAAGGGRGAALGAAIGGVTGFIADQSVRHHDRW